jgi:hypothetical protein
MDQVEQGRIQHDRPKGHQHLKKYGQASCYRCQNNCVDLNRGNKSRN